MSGGVFGEVDASRVEEYQPKIHYMINDNSVLCDTSNPREGTDDKEVVTCKRCLKRLEDAEEIEARGNIPLMVSMTVDSPKITKARGKQVLLGWLNMIPDDVKLEVIANYSDGPYLRASWSQPLESK